MKKISKINLKSFERAIYKDYGIKLKQKDLEESASNLLEFAQTMIKYGVENEQVLKSST